MNDRTGTNRQNSTADETTIMIERFAIRTEDDTAHFESTSDLGVAIKGSPLSDSNVISIDERQVLIRLGVDDGPLSIVYVDSSAGSASVSDADYAALDDAIAELTRLRRHLGQMLSAEDMATGS